MNATAKRPRSSSTQGSNNPPAEEPTRDDDLWHTDGNIVLSVQSKLFKIHKSMLASNSSFFRDMWDLPQPEGAQKIDGSDVVELKFDDPNDWKDFLEVLYRGHRVSWSLDRVGFSRIASRLRIATKYLFDDVRAKVVEILDDQWGSDPNSPNDREDRQDFYIIGPHPGLVIKLAEECNLPGILPMAYYDLMTVPRWINNLTVEVMPHYWNDPSLEHTHLRKVLIAESRLKRWIKNLKAWGKYHGDGDFDGDYDVSCYFRSRTYVRQEVRPTLHESYDIWAQLTETGESREIEELELCSDCEREAVDYFFRKRGRALGSLAGYVRLKIGGVLLIKYTI